MRPTFLKIALRLKDGHSGDVDPTFRTFPFSPLSPHHPSYKTILHPIILRASPFPLTFPPQISLPLSPISSIHGNLPKTHITFPHHPSHPTFTPSSSGRRRASTPKWQAGGASQHPPPPPIHRSHRTGSLPRPLWMTPHHPLLPKPSPVSETIMEADPSISDGEILYWRTVPASLPGLIPRIWGENPLTVPTGGLSQTSRTGAILPSIPSR